MIGALLVTALCAAPKAQEIGATQAPQEVDAARRVELLLAWREALELDLAAEVLDSARPLVEGGALARDGESLALYSQALAATGGATRARALLEGATPSAATRSAVEVELARLDLEQDRLDAVERRLAAAGEVPVAYPERAECWLVLGRARVRAGRAAAAAPLLRRFVEGWPLHREGPSAWHMLAQEAVLRRDVDAARACRERAREAATWHGYYRARRLQIREQPEAPLPRLGLAQLWLAVDELERARAVLLDLVARAPEFCRGHATLGEVERKRGDLPAARAAYDRALECDPELDDVRYNRALLALAEERRADALADLEALLERPAAEEPRFIAAHLTLARLLLALDRAEDARARYAAYRERGGTETLE